MSDETDELIRGVLDSIPEQLRVAEDRITPAVQEEYLSYTQSIAFDQYSEQAILTKSENLFSSSTPIEVKKKTLGILAHRGGVQSYRIIEKYLEVAEPGLKDWAVLALQECRMFLESYLLDRDIGMVMTGLGGEGNKLRYFFVIRSKRDIPLTGGQQAMLERVFCDVCHTTGSVLEDIQVCPSYATMQVLVPMDVAVAQVIEGGIDSCNKVEDILDVRYFTTNVGIPSDAEVLDLLREQERAEGLEQ